MCLFVPKDGKIEKARKDIKVYKNVINDETCWRPPYYRTLSFDYNKVNTAMDDRNPIEHLCIEDFLFDYCKGCIHEGFHSMLKREDVIFGEVTDLRICIIPKGSEYCIGIHGDVVSVKLVVFKTWFDYVLFRLKSIWRDTIGRVVGI